MFRWGVVGSGYAARKFVLGLRTSRLSRVTMVYSRNGENARRFATDLGVARATDELDAALANDVDGVYIATPPTTHRALALAAFSAGKHVLIEKPFSASTEDAATIIAAARAQRLFCMEGLWNLHIPAANAIAHTLESGKIGTPRSFAGSFGTSNIPSPDDNQFNFALGGGALLHRAIYPISWALHLLGPAKLVSAVATLDEAGLDEDCTVILRHDSGPVSTLRASLRAPLPNDFTLEGDCGLLHIKAPIYRPFRYTLSRSAPAHRLVRGSGGLAALRESSLAQGVQQRLAPVAGVLGEIRGAAFIPYRGNGYHYQADEVARMVAQSRTESPVAPLCQTLNIAQLLDAARASWRR